MDVTNLIEKRPKDISIEMLKFFAAIIIVNSHMSNLYVHFPQLATGGAIGDAIFFFCSGYGLFLSQKRSFGNYYKRRIGRIYPSIFAWAIISAFILHENHDMKHIVLYGGGWFVTCIMVYYIFFWFIHRYLLKRLITVLCVVIILSFICFFVFDSSVYINIYGGGFSRFIFFFGFMLLGGIIGYHKKYCYVGSLLKNMILFLLSITCFYAILIFSGIFVKLWEIQILSLFALGGVVVSSLGICKTKRVERLFKRFRLFGFIGGLCLEMYIVQFSLFTTKMNNLFPLNLLLMFVIVVLAAYILKISARLFEQLFRKEDFNWRSIMTI